jgi:hypothetical protein
MCKPYTVNQDSLPFLICAVLSQSGHATQCSLDGAKCSLNGHSIRYTTSDRSEVYQSSATNIHPRQSLAPQIPPPFNQFVQQYPCRNILSTYQVPKAALAHTYSLPATRNGTIYTPTSPALAWSLQDVRGFALEPKEHRRGVTQVARQAALVLQKCHTRSLTGCAGVTKVSRKGSGRLLWRCESVTRGVSSMADGCVCGLNPCLMPMCAAVSWDSWSGTFVADPRSLAPYQV